MVTQWSEICNQLDIYFDAKRRYFYHQEYTGNDQFIMPLIVPDGFEDKHAFQTKVRNYFAICEPYGTYDDVTIVWPPGGNDARWNEAIERHKRTYPKYQYYKTIIIIDYTMVNESGNPDLISRMDLTRDKVIELCDSLTDYGWSYRIVNDFIEYTQFIEENNNFYNKS